MIDYKELRRILNGSGMSSAKYSNGKTVVKDSNVFKGAKLSAIEEAQALVEKAIKEDTVSYSNKLGIKQLDSLKDVNDRAVRAVGGIIDCLGAKKKVTAQELREQMTTATANRDSIFNPRWNLGNGVDPSRMNVAFPNIYISPWEANSLYSQKGLFETVINKKAKSILLNGLRIENPKLTTKELDTINEKVDVLDIKHTISDPTRD